MDGLLNNVKLTNGTNYPFCNYRPVLTFTPQ